MNASHKEKARTMKTFGVIAALAAGLALQAQAVEETVLGYLNNGITVPSNTDVIASAPFTGTPAFDGTVSSGTANSLTISGASFTANQYQNLSHVRLRSGVDNGLWTTIVSNNATTVFTADDVSTVVAGDSIEIVAHQTLGSVFPATLANVAFVPSTGPTVPLRKTTVQLISSPTTIGINRAPGSGGVFYFYNGHWRKTTDGTGTINYDNTVLVPQQYYVIRNGGGVSQALQVLTAGAVNPPTIATYTVRSTAQNDNPLATGRPLDLSLPDLGIGGSSAFVDSTGTGVAFRRDAIYLFNNSATGQNKAPGSGGTFFRLTDGTWHSTASGTPDVTTNLLLGAGTGFVIRKYTNAVTQAEVWAETN